MSELYFRLGEAEGFTSKKLADKKEGYANPIRELLQNSLDASKEAGNEKCDVNIYIESIQKSSIPHIQSYENTLNQAIKYHKKEGSYGANAKQTVGFIQAALKEENIDVLMFVDNGIGMSPNTLNGLIGERSIKSDESSGGSFGVGHLSSYFLSSLRYVLYASKYEEKWGGRLKACSAARQFWQVMKMKIALEVVLVES
jgi:HSP90 family molecular chaperone